MGEEEKWNFNIWRKTLKAFSLDDSSEYFLLAYVITAVISVITYLMIRNVQTDELNDTEEQAFDNSAGLGRDAGSTRQTIRSGEPHGSSDTYDVSSGASTSASTSYAITSGPSSDSGAARSTSFNTTIGVSCDTIPGPGTSYDFRSRIESILWANTRAGTNSYISVSNSPNFNACTTSGFSVGSSPALTAFTTSGISVGNSLAITAFTTSSICISNNPTLSTFTTPSICIESNPNLSVWNTSGISASTSSYFRNDIRSYIGATSGPGFSINMNLSVSSRITDSSRYPNISIGIDSSIRPIISSSHGILPVFNPNMNSASNPGNSAGIISEINSDNTGNRVGTSSNTIANTGFGIHPDISIAVSAGTSTRHNTEDINRGIYPNINIGTNPDINAGAGTSSGIRAGNNTGVVTQRRLIQRPWLTEPPEVSPEGQGGRVKKLKILSLQLVLGQILRDNPAPEPVEMMDYEVDEEIEEQGGGVKRHITDASDTDSEPPVKRAKTPTSECKTEDKPEDDQNNTGKNFTSNPSEPDFQHQSTSSACDTNFTSNPSEPDFQHQSTSSACDTNFTSNPSEPDFQHPSTSSAGNNNFTSNPSKPDFQQQSTSSASSSNFTCNPYEPYFQHQSTSSAFFDISREIINYQNKLEESINYQNRLAERVSYQNRLADRINYQNRFRQTDLTDTSDSDSDRPEVLDVASNASLETEISLTPEPTPNAAEINTPQPTQTDYIPRVTRRLCFNISPIRFPDGLPPELISIYEEQYRERCLLDLQFLKEDANFITAFSAAFEETFITQPPLRHSGKLGSPMGFYRDYSVLSEQMYAVWSKKLRDHIRKQYITSNILLANQQAHFMMQLYQYNYIELLEDCSIRREFVPAVSYSQLTMTIVANMVRLTF